MEPVTELIAPIGLIQRFCLLGSAGRFLLKFQLAFSMTASVFDVPSTILLI